MQKRNFVFYKLQWGYCINNYSQNYIISRAIIILLEEFKSRFSLKS